MRINNYYVSIFNLIVNDLTHRNNYNSFCISSRRKSAIAISQSEEENTTKVQPSKVSCSSSLNTQEKKKLGIYIINNKSNHFVCCVQYEYVEQPFTRIYVLKSIQNF